MLPLQFIMTSFPTDRCITKTVDKILTTLLLAVEAEPHLQRKGHTLLLEFRSPLALGDADAEALVTVTETDADPNEYCRLSE